jgi:hypothetical protein
METFIEELVPAGKLCCSFCTGKVWRSCQRVLRSGQDRALDACLDHSRPANNRIMDVLKIVNQSQAISEKIEDNPDAKATCTSPSCMDSQSTPIRDKCP